MTTATTRKLSCAHRMDNDVLTDDVGEAAPADSGGREFHRRLLDDDPHERDDHVWRLSVPLRRFIHSPHRIWPSSMNSKWEVPQSGHPQGGSPRSRERPKGRRW